MHVSIESWDDAQTEQPDDNAEDVSREQTIDTLHAILKDDPEALDVILSALDSHWLNLDIRNDPEETELMDKISEILDRLARIE